MGLFSRKPRGGEPYYPKKSRRLPTYSEAISKMSFVCGTFYNSGVHSHEGPIGVSL